MGKNKIQAGDIFETNNYGVCEVIEYISSKNVKVRFKDTLFETSCAAGELRNGEVKDYMKPNIFGVGFIGAKVPYVTKKKSYECWSNMLMRSYSEDYKANRKTYEKCTVAPEWHNFQTFAKWHDDNFPKDTKGLRYELDKDILFKGNKVYSKDTCVFVPKIINSLLVKSDSIRGKYPLGVVFDKERCKYAASLKIDGKRKHLGRFDSESEAFLSYKKAKESHIKLVATKLFNQGCLGAKVHHALMNYKVCIDD